MAEYSEKWKKSFEKKYSKTIKELQSLENEYKEMVESNPNEWISIYPDESIVTFGPLDGYWASHWKAGEDEDFPQENVSLSLNSKLGNFSFRIESLEQLIKLRNDLLEISDKFSRTEPPVKIVDPNECEDEEGWEDNEEQDLVSPVLQAGSKLGYVHIGASHRGPLGTGNIDFDSFFGALAKIGYKGTITFESFSSTVVAPDLSSTLGIWRNLWTDNKSMAKSAREYIENKIISAQKI